MNARWKYIKGFERLYKINSKGVILSVKSNILMKPALVRGYHQIGLRKDGRYHLLYVHRLVAMAFIHNPENKPFINHKNGLKTDNRVKNLEWCTRSENTRHAWSAQLRKTTSNYNNGKSIKVLQKDKQGAIIRIWNSYKEMKASGYISAHYVREAIAGKRLNYKDSIWELLK
jgi:hypothetical protein